jgi:hypothetical protein
MFVDRGEVVLIADSQGVRDIYSADGNALDAATPLAVLVNKGTASAAEVRGGAGAAPVYAPLGQRAEVLQAGGHTWLFAPLAAAR